MPCFTFYTPPALTLVFSVPTSATIKTYSPLDKEFLFFYPQFSNVSHVSPQCSRLQNKQYGHCFLTYGGYVSLPLENQCFSSLNLELSGTLLDVSLGLFFLIHFSKVVINSPMSYFSQSSSVLTKSGLT